MEREVYDRFKAEIVDSNFMVHIWLDDPELGWSTVAVTDGDPDLAESLAGPHWLERLERLHSVMSLTPWEIPVGGMATVHVGSELETVYSTSLEFSGEVTHRVETRRYGKTVILRDRGIHLIVSERPTNVGSPDYFKELGLRPRRADVVVVKNLFPFRFTFIGVNMKTVNVMTPGTTSGDVWELEYNSIPRPIYPLDEIEDWRPESN